MEPSERKPPRSGHGCLFSIVCLFVFFSLIVVVLAWLLTRGPSVPDRAYLVLKVGPELAAEPPGELESIFLGPGGPSIPDLHRSLGRAASDARIAGVLLDLEGGSLDLAQAEELGRLLKDLRKAGKKVVAYANDLDLRSWYAACAADITILNPAGQLRLTGISYEVLLFGGVLEKLGLKADLRRVGDYKTAWEAFTGTELTEKSREAVEAVVGGTWGELLKQIGQARGIEPSQVEAIVNAGPLPAAAALEKGLVDRVLWREELAGLLAGEFGEKAEAFPWSTYVDNVDRRPAGTRIAYLPVAGLIVSGDGFRGMAGADSAARELGRLRDDPTIAAVVVYVDSSGGDGLASARLYHAIRDTKKKKPVVVAMGSRAASGGYYVAAAADHVVAGTFTITGSIGVFGGKLIATGLAAELGLKHEAFRRGAFAGFGDPLEPLSAEAGAMLERDLGAFYDRFLADVAEGRKKTVDEIRPLAGGRIWTGADARERGLVDALGGLGDAVATARELARISGESELVLWPPRRPWYEEIFRGRSGLESSRAAGGILAFLRHSLTSARPLALAPLVIAWE